MRLTKDMKTEIVDALLAHKFKPLVAELAKEVATFAVAAHAAHFGDRLARMNALPKGWLHETDVMNSARYEDNYYSIYYNGQIVLRYSSAATHFVFTKYKVEGGKKYLRHLSSETSVKPKNAGPLLDKVITLQKEYDEMRSQLNSTLYPFNNADKLIEHWPEVKPFVPDYVPPVKNLPAVQSGELNAKLGLPV